MLLHLLIFLSALLVVSFSIPSIIYVAFKKRLFDMPSEERKIHKKIIPNLGGIAIFTGFLFSTSLFIKSTLLPEAGVILASGIILFVIGLKDDLVGMSPVKKLLAQIIAAMLVAVLADIRIRSMHGLLGLNDFSYPVSVGLTVLVIVAVVNAFNLVDGIDGLAGSLGVVVSLTYSLLFYLMGDMGWSYMAIAMAGSLIGFLIYNVSPAKIFMGDTGSLLVGMISAVLSVQFIDLSNVHTIQAFGLGIHSSPALVMAILIIPLFDTTRVFTLRILNSESPFKADRNHLHHRLIDLKLSHSICAFILVGVNLLFISLALAFQHIGTMELLLVLSFFAVFFNSTLTILLNKRKKKDLIVQDAKHTADSLATDPKEEKEKFVESILERIAKN
ncbi:undecaprenyl/decaprenyl-phosphate alpha-N-acetylglucosaminyl 1-phosphate transferase [Solitalea longa]|uniref:Undecaprenyl/decaprenyl-phosphate alpha-N-acetylglucosaminyl 1-phosphate transferase n=1 Tax=Solitalea longa TaxID=2079460 RepID=A0A2S5A9Q8_9SPHI|nr:MraY family glycosyltransferase [Solitalea longa]POY39256.1 undecaprenyl/decaprenyl-phosphate alpha-N-acetylglucosaminyl 1-phosphate transferase [Solitalea longa]